MCWFLVDLIRIAMQQCTEYVGITAHNTCDHVWQNKLTWRSRTGNYEETFSSKVIQRWFWRSSTLHRSVTKMDALHLLFSQVHLKRWIAENISPLVILGLKLERVAMPCALLQTGLWGSCPKCAFLNILQADTSHAFGKTYVHQHSVANANLTSCFDTNDTFV